MEELFDLINTINEHKKIMFKNLKPEVDNIINNKETNIKYIDGMFDKLIEIIYDNESERCT